jgi:hypothetical protein
LSSYIATAYDTSTASFFKIATDEREEETAEEGWEASILGGG